jgi:threonine/homoserine/homoserine lactone efflux protein
MPPAQQLIAFVVAGLLLNLTPGPDVLYIVARSTSQGRSAGLVSALGIGAGCLVHVTAAAAGLSALMVQLPVAYQVVRWVGAAYLVWLGARAIMQKRTPLTPQVTAAQPLARIFWQGVLTNVLNPKVALFFLAFLPQFTDPARGSLGAQFLELGLLFDLNATFVNFAFALAASRFGDWLRKRFDIAHVLNKITGGIFIALGLRLLAGTRTPGR